MELIPAVVSRTINVSGPQPGSPMPISPQLLRNLQETLGADAADDLVSWMDAMDGNRGDVAELRHETQLGFARIDARFAQLEVAIERGLREQTRFFFLAWSVLLAAMIGLYSR